MPTAGKPAGRLFFDLSEANYKSKIYINNMEKDKIYETGVFWSKNVIYIETEKREGWKLATLTDYGQACSAYSPTLALDKGTP
jgi:hypothetical protein